MTMHWLRTFLGVAEPYARQLERIAAQRWVVLDVETSGLDQGSDALLAIGAVAVSGQRIVVADSFEVLLRQRNASMRSNILVHGIGGQAQLAGADPAESCRRFVEYVGESPIVGFHCSFDRAFLARTLKVHVERPWAADWLDLAGLAPALNAGVDAKALDDWLDHFGLSAEQRHDASADAFATAMLFLRLLKQVPPPQRTIRHLQKLSLAQRWAGGS
jgi:DNA polymerase III subunit epsilon